MNTNRETALTESGSLFDAAPAFCCGRRRAKSRTLVRTTAAARAIVHDAKTPYSGSVAASATRSTIFRIENPVLEIGTQLVRRRPVIALSSSTKTHHAAVAAANQSRSVGDAPIAARLGTKTPMPWPKTKLAIAARAMLTPKVIRMNLVACRPASGTKRMSAQ